MIKLETVLEEYSRIDMVGSWSTPEKAAARSALRCIIAQAGLYGEFLDALEQRTHKATINGFEENTFGAVIRF